VGRARVAQTAWRGRTTPRLKVTCKITDLVFLFDWAVALRRMILDLGVNVEGSPVLIVERVNHDKPEPLPEAARIGFRLDWLRLT
jgi:hypothetical protein